MNDSLGRHIGEGSEPIWRYLKSILPRQLIEANSTYGHRDMNAKEKAGLKSFLEETKKTKTQRESTTTDGGQKSDSASRKRHHGDVFKNTNNEEAGPSTPKRQRQESGLNIPPDEMNALVSRDVHQYDTRPSHGRKRSHYEDDDDFNWDQVGGERPALKKLRSGNLAAHHSNSEQPHPQAADFDLDVFRSRDGSNDILDYTGRNGLVPDLGVHRDPPSYPPGAFDPECHFLRPTQPNQEVGISFNDYTFNDDAHPTYDFPNVFLQPDEPVSTNDNHYQEATQTSNQLNDIRHVSSEFSDDLNLSAFQLPESMETSDAEEVQHTGPLARVPLEVGKTYIVVCSEDKAAKKGFVMGGDYIAWEQRDLKRVLREIETLEAQSMIINTVPQKSKAKQLMSDEQVEYADSDFEAHKTYTIVCADTKEAHKGVAVAGEDIFWLQEQPLDIVCEDILQMQNGVAIIDVGNLNAEEDRVSISRNTEAAQRESASLSDCSSDYGSIPKRMTVSSTRIQEGWQQSRPLVRRLWELHKLLKNPQVLTRLGSRGSHRKAWRVRLSEQ